MYIYILSFVIKKRCIITSCSFVTELCFDLPPRDWEVLEAGRFQGCIPGLLSLTRRGYYIATERDA